MHAQLNFSQDPRFDGLRIDTCANRAWIMSNDQYSPYWKEFGLTSTIIPAPNRGVKFIGGRQQAVGRVRVQIPFGGLHIFIDVCFLITQSDILTLLSMNDMIGKNLDITFLERCITYNGLCRPLTLDNNFLIHRWEARAFLSPCKPNMNSDAYIFSSATPPSAQQRIY